MSTTTAPYGYSHKVLTDASGESYYMFASDIPSEAASYAEAQQLHELNVSPVTLEVLDRYAAELARALYQRPTLRCSAGLPPPRKDARPLVSARLTCAAATPSGCGTKTTWPTDGFRQRRRAYLGPGGRCSR